MTTLKTLRISNTGKQIAKVVLATMLTLAPAAVTFAQISLPCFAGMNCTTRVNSATGLIAFIIQLALLLVGSVAILFLIWGGFRYITAGGNPDAVKKARATITNAIIGLVVVILAWVLVYAVVNVVTNIPSTGGSTP